MCRLQPLHVAPSARCSAVAGQLESRLLTKVAALLGAFDAFRLHLRQAEALEAEEDKEGDAATGTAKPEGGGKGKGRGRGEGGGKGRGRGGGERRNEFAANRPKRNDKGVGGKPEKGGSKSTGSKAAVRPARPHHLSLAPLAPLPHDPGPQSPPCPLSLRRRGGPATTHRMSRPCPFPSARSRRASTLPPIRSTTCRPPSREGWRVGVGRERRWGPVMATRPPSSSRRARPPRRRRTGLAMQRSARWITQRCPPPVRAGPRVAPIR